MELPEEIWIEIFCYLEPIPLLKSCSFVNSSWKRMSRDSRIWKRHCLKNGKSPFYFKGCPSIQREPFPDEEKDNNSNSNVDGFERVNIGWKKGEGWNWWNDLQVECKEENQVNWYFQFKRRVEKENKVEKIVDSIIRSRQGSIKQLIIQIRDLGHEALEKLLLMRRSTWRLIPQLFSSSSSPYINELDGKLLSKGYWLEELVGFMERWRLITMAKYLCQGKQIPLQDLCLAMERCLRKTPLKEEREEWASKDLDDWTFKIIIPTLKGLFPKEDLSNPSLEVIKKLVEMIVEHCRDPFSPDDTFLGHAIQSGHSLPIARCALLHCVASKMGFHIEMIGFPYHFLAAYKQQGMDDKVFITMFDGGKLMNRSELQKFAESSLFVWKEEYMDQVSHSEVLMRMARNVASTDRNPQGRNRFREEERVYLASIVLTELERSDAQPQTWHIRMRHVFERHNLDAIHFQDITESQVATHFKSKIDSVLDSPTEDQITKKRRNFTSDHILNGKIPQYRLGQVFKHKLREYIGIIVGWDYTCAAEEQWITRMGVDDLSNGRNQPFYSVWVTTDGTQRYVAEENIILEGASISDSSISEVVTDVGRYFDSFIPSEKHEEGQFYGRFVPCHDLQFQYPDD
eukprot:TRINITY_DN3056_c0_g1_i3.p1 TRINITY_DN3056_c0_g1~~TRINITY_DN3056_c0_g1_i3.p1  ORF type:complete len:628 (+),score=109.71 TRINITY_DN3056_c0_g1_i3:285-2168(+)